MKVTKLPSQSFLVPSTQQGPEKARDALVEWSAMAKEAYSKNTQRRKGRTARCFRGFARGRDWSSSPRRR